ncbi:MAG: hypothetical protein HRU20_00490 [Pseudomonadales bacterium]|nr:hypothetical protein [Pseudomonadales bacterium]
MEKYIIALSLLLAGLSGLSHADESAEKNTHSEYDRGTFSFYAPIHATNLKVEGLPVPVESSVGDLFDAHTHYFTFGFKWQGEKWFHSVEIWEGQYEPFGSGKSISGPLGKTNADVYLDMRQRISEYRTGYNFLRSGDFKFWVIGGLREYDQTVDVYSQLSKTPNIPTMQGLGDVNKDTLNSRWAEITIGLQVDYSIMPNLTLTGLHMAGVIGGSSKQTDVKMQYAMDNGLFFDAGYRWHKFDSDGLEITENGALIGFGYQF